MDCDQPSVLVPAEISEKCKKLIFKEQGQPVLEGLQLLLQNNLVNPDTPAEEGPDMVNVDALISRGISWLVQYPHAALGVASNADVPVVRKAFKKLALKYHPDKNPATKILFQVISSACEVLCSNKKTIAEVCEHVNRARYEQYRDNFARRQEQLQRQQELQKKMEEERRERELKVELQRQQAEQEKARNVREAEEEDANWRSQRRQRRHQSCNDSTADDRSTDRSQQSSRHAHRNKRSSLPTMDGEGKRAGSMSNKQHDSMLTTEELKWRKLQNQFDKLVSEVNKGEAKMRKQMEQHKLFRQDSTLPFLPKKPTKIKSARPASDPHCPSHGIPRRSWGKPTSAPHTHIRRNDPVNHPNHSQAQPMKPPQRPKTERVSGTVRRTQTMPERADEPPAATPKQPNPTFSDGCADLRKKYDHLFSQKAYTTHNRKNAPMKRSESLPSPTSPDLRDVEFNYDFASCI